MAKWPQKRRKVLIPCSLCNEPTDQPKGVCPDCVQVYKRGQRAIKADTADEKTLCIFPRHDLDHWYSHGANIDPEDHFSFSETLGLLVDNLSSVVDYNSYTNRQPVIILRRPVNNDFGPGYVGLMLKQSQAIAAYRLIRAVHTQIDKAYDNGYRDGSSLLHRMATGSLTIDQINNAHLKREE